MNIDNGFGNVKDCEEQELSDKEPPGCLSQFNCISQRSIDFYTKNFQGTSVLDWNDWKWQFRNRITTKEQLEKFITLSDVEKEIFALHKGNLPLAITPYYMSLINKASILDPIRKCSIPRIEETIESKDEMEDPLDEDKQSPVSCIVHRYPDRVLFLSTKICSVNCRYCTRSRLVGDKKDFCVDRTEWNKGFEYIKNHKEIRDVIVSGGDPLTLSDENIEYILSNLRSIEHVDIIRIGTKIPAVLPQRITNNLVTILKKYHPLFMSLHFTHSNELTVESNMACSMLADAGIPLGSQTVLLKGINDNVEDMRDLMKGLLKTRVRPYYIYVCDLVKGSSHFRTNVKVGQDIIYGLRGWISGYGVPQLIIDAPNGKGKIPVLPEYIQEEKDGKLIIKNYKGEIFTY